MSKQSTTTNNFDQFFNPTGSTNWNTEAGCSQIDSKDLGTVQDALYNEALAYKKCSLYADRLTDPQLKTMAANAAHHHKQHFDSLQRYLDGTK
ncbi:MAG: hypothetical protein IJA35_07415 [Clostridia bacterium]|nr:hypothetical protein [Clostridia bacterium]